MKVMVQHNLKEGGVGQRFGIGALMIYLMSPVFSKEVYHLSIDILQTEVYRVKWPRISTFSVVAHESKGNVQRDSQCPFTST